MNKVYITLAGSTKKEVEEKLESLYKNYHPAIYHVRFGEIKLDENGQWFTEGSRATHCD